jgi:hypothetical protein
MLHTGMIAEGRKIKFRHNSDFRKSTVSKKQQYSYREERQSKSVRAFFLCYSLAIGRDGNAM